MTNPAFRVDVFFFFCFHCRVLLFSPPSPFTTLSLTHTLICDANLRCKSSSPSSSCANILYTLYPNIVKWTTTTAATLNKTNKTNKNNGRKNVEKKWKKLNTNKLNKSSKDTIIKQCENTHTEEKNTVRHVAKIKKKHTHTIHNNTHTRRESVDRKKGKNVEEEEKNKLSHKCIIN